MGAIFIPQLFFGAFGERNLNRSKARCENETDRSPGARKELHHSSLMYRANTDSRLLTGSGNKEGKRAAKISYRH